MTPSSSLRPQCPDQHTASGLRGEMSEVTHGPFLTHYDPWGMPPGPKHVPPSWKGWAGSHNLPQLGDLTPFWVSLQAQ